MSGKPQRLLSAMPEVNAFAVVEKLLADMKAAAVSGNIPRYENLSDQLAVFSRAYAIPMVENRWAEYNLTPTETIMADLLYAKLNQNVRRTSLMDAAYFSRPDEELDIKIIDVLICKIRKKLANSPYRIVNVWAFGYSMVPQESARVNERNVGPRKAA